jgi:hypothetical protein
VHTHGQTPGATLLTAAAKLWQLPSLPAEAVVMHMLAYVALATASKGQQEARRVQAPVDEPPSPPDDPPPPLELPPDRQADEQLLDKQLKTGPSQVAQVPLTQACSWDLHMVSTQPTHVIV